MIPTFSTPKFAIGARRNLLAALGGLPTDPVIRANLGVPVVIVQDFAQAQHVLVADADSYVRPGFIRRTMIAGLGDNLFSVTNDEWLRRRRPVAPMLAANQMNGLASLIAHSVAERVDGWPVGLRDAQDAMTELTLDVACRAMLGIDADAGGIGHTIRAEFETIVYWLSTHLQNPLLPPASIPTPSNRRMRRAKSNLDRAVADLIVERRRGGVSGDDLLGRLLAAQCEQSASDVAGLTDAEIVDECVGMMFAGHETTASTLTWALYELAVHPEVQARVASEGDALDLASTALFDDVAASAVTDAVVEETLRLYPSAISIARVATRTTEIAGRRIRKGTIVLVGVYRIQRDPEVWDRPNRFVPNRALPTTDSGVRDSFVAFGLGPRRCLGARFARTELRLALAVICSRWQVSYRGTAAPVAEVSPSLRVRGALPLEFVPRAGG